MNAEARTCSMRRENTMTSLRVQRTCKVQIIQLKPPISLHLTAPLLRGNLRVLLFAGFVIELVCG